MQRLTKEEFIAKARRAHGSRYNYDNVVYVNNHTNVEIICPVHGGFMQRPYSHVANKPSGCPFCRCQNSQGMARRLGDKYTQEQFLQLARKVHGDTYDYSKAVYDGMYVKITVICRVHGEFQQFPGNHLDGNRCRKCAMKGVASRARATIAAKQATTESKLDALKARFEEMGQFEHHKRALL